MFEFIKNLFIKVEPIQEKQPVTIKDLEELSDVWIDDNGELYKGWVWEKTNKHIIVLYGDGLDYKFNIIRPLTRTVIAQNHKILYCNNPIKD